MSEPNAERRARTEPRIRRRNRLINSCLECRRRKLKCDKLQPCTNCTKFSRPCVFMTSAYDPDAQAKLAEVKEKMGMLERKLETEVAGKSVAKGKAVQSIEDVSQLLGQELGSDQEQELREPAFPPSELFRETANYGEDDEHEEFGDLAIALGKLRMTERIGGMVRPRFPQELAFLAGQISGADSPAIDGQKPTAWAAPNKVSTAPSSSFVFSPNVQASSALQFVPSQKLADKILEHYWVAVHLIARTVHRPSFERRYASFWKAMSGGQKPRASMQAIVLAVLLSSVISMADDKVSADFGVEKEAFVEHLRQGTETALANANFLNSTKFETFQAFIIYLVALCRAEISQGHSTLTGTCIRLAEIMGLHCDPTTYTDDPVEIQVRRLMWYQVCFLDMRTCDNIGPRPQIRKDEFNTRLPLNVEDDELDRAKESGEQISQDSTKFTDVTITKMRAEYIEVSRWLWVERVKFYQATEEIEKRNILKMLLSRIQTFRAGMEKVYLPMLSRTNPRHVIAMEMYGIISSRLIVTTLFLFKTDNTRPMPEKLRQIMMSACVMVIEHSMNIEHQPALQQWSWFIGALHQYHHALLLALEMVTGEVDELFATRCWRSLDFAFSLPPDMDRQSKLRMTLGELANRGTAFLAARNVRPPKDMSPPQPGYDRYMNPKSSQASSASPEKRETNSSNASERSRRASNSPAIQTQPSSPGRSSKSPQVRAFYPASALPMRGPLGSMPQTDWGSWDIEPTPPPVPHPVESKPRFSGLSPIDHAMGIPDLSEVGIGSNIIDTSISASITDDRTAPRQSGQPGLHDIDWRDWNEWDPMFGSAQVGSENMIIPPFTFPSMEFSKMEWSS